MVVRFIKGGITYYAMSERKLSEESRESIEENREALESLRNRDNPASELAGKVLDLAD